MVQDSSTSNGFKIGTAAKMAGISPNTIRTWMRRAYFQASIETESGERILSSEDLKRLKTLKNLIDMGDSIGRIAKLDDDALDRRLGELRSNSDPAFANDIPSLTDLEAAFVSPDGSSRLSAAQPLFWNTLQLNSVESLTEHCREEHRLSIALIEFQNRNQQETEHILNFVSENPEISVVVVFDFLARAHIQELSSANVHLLRWPINSIMIERYLYSMLPSISRNRIQNPTISEPPTKLLTERQLNILCETVPTVACECPRHVSSLVSSLAAFEEYSKNCVNTSPQDEELHRYLHRETARARHIMELALIRLCREDGIELPSP